LVIEDAAGCRINAAFVRLQMRTHSGVRVPVQAERSPA